MRGPCPRAIVVVLLFLLVASRWCIAADRFSLGQQPQVYLIHQTAKKTFELDSTLERVSRFSGGSVLSSAAIVGQRRESALLQQKLNLEDPVQYGKSRLAETLRVELGLTNLTVISEVSDLPVIKDDLGKTARSFEETPGYTPQMAASAEQEAAAEAEKAETFQKKNPSGMVIEMVTQHWGLDSAKVKYYANFRLISLTDSKVLLTARCAWVVIEPVNRKKLAAADPSFDPLSLAHAEDRVFADNGALLKTSLRKAAEQCVDKVARKFF